MRGWRRGEDLVGALLLAVMYSWDFFFKHVSRKTEMNAVEDVQIRRQMESLFLRLALSFRRRLLFCPLITRF